MGGKDLAEYLGEKQAKRVAELVEKADFSKCNAGPEMKEVYQFMITSLGFLVHEKRNDNSGNGTEIKLFGGKVLSLKGKNLPAREIMLIIMALAVFVLIAKEIIQAFVV